MYILEVVYRYLFNYTPQMDAMYEVLKRQDDYDSEMDTTPDPRGYDPRHTLGHQMSEDWLSANMPQVPSR